MSAYGPIVINFLLSEQGLSMLAWIGAAMAAWVGKQVHSRWKAGSIQERLFTIAQGAVADTYAAVVRAWKIQAGDGKLTPEQAEQAMERTMALVAEEAKKIGLDALKEAGPLGLRAIIERAINSQKPAKQAPLPVAVEAMFPDVEAKR